MIHQSENEILDLQYLLAMKTHVLTWVIANISNTSHFLFSKIISFLCFQMFYMIDIQTILYTSLRLLPNPASLNPNQWLWASLWCTFCTQPICHIIAKYYYFSYKKIIHDLQFPHMSCRNTVNIVYYNPSLAQQIPGWNSTMQHPPCIQRSNGRAFRPLQFLKNLIILPTSSLY